MKTEASHAPSCLRRPSTRQMQTQTTACTLLMPSACFASRWAHGGANSVAGALALTPAAAPLTRRLLHARRAMQVLPCSKRFCHDWVTCPFAHPAEKAKRRDPRAYTYTGVACPDQKKVRSAATRARNACPSTGVATARH